jgi:signal transduction histidine kinase
MSLELQLELRRLRHGQHICLFYDSRAETLADIGSYCKDGLTHGERCLLATGTDDDVREIADALRNAGIDVEREVERDAMGILTPGRSGFFGGYFEPRAEVRGLERLVEQALSDGFRGLRTCGEVRYAALGELYDEAKVFELEAFLDEAIPRLALIQVCLFDLRRAPASLIRCALRVHPLVVVGPLVCPNAFYEPARMVLGQCPEEERTRWMIGQLYRCRADKLALEKAVHARDEFLSAASHELNTPLTSTRLHVQSVLQRAERSADDSLSASWVSGKLGRADEQLDRLVEMIGQLLDVSQLQDTGRVDLRLEATDLGEVVRDAVARFDERARHGCSVQFDASPAPVVGRWDRKRLAQVVTNVLSNAFKFGAGKPVSVQVSGDGVLGRVVVRDQGIGIAREELASIFDRFQRGVPVCHYGGFGLGLWIVKEIVEAFGGHIGATGTPGAGATFTIELPQDANRA